MDCQPRRSGYHGCLRSCVVRGAYSRFRASDARVLQSRRTGNICCACSAEDFAASNWCSRRGMGQSNGQRYRSARRLYDFGDRGQNGPEIIARFSASYFAWLYACRQWLASLNTNTRSRRAARSHAKAPAFLSASGRVKHKVFPATEGSLRLAWGEDAQYKLDGLLLEIEANRRNKVDNKVVRQALGFVSYDDSAGRVPHAHV